MKSFILLCWFSWALSVRARGHAPDFCFDGCDLALWGFVFNDTSQNLTPYQDSHDQNTNTTSLNYQKCSNALRIPSLYLCLKLYCLEDHRIEGLKKLNESCEAKLPGYESVVGQYGGEEMGRLRKVVREDYEGGWRNKLVLREVVVLSESVWGLGRDTLAAVSFETRIHNVYGCAMYAFWIIIILIGLSSHLGQHLLSTGTSTQNSSYRSLPSDDSHDTSPPSSTPSKRTIFDTTYILLKKYITVPATFGYTRSQNIGWCTIPTRVQSLALATFVVMNVVLCCCSYWIFEGNMYWPKTSDQFLRYFADRTGIISTANLPLVWAFGIRNNTLLWLTGWDFAAYNMFHRWVARVATVQAVLHSVAYTVMIVLGGGSWAEAWVYYLTYYEKRYFWMGVLATIFMCAILVASVYPLRRNFYEIFLWLHIIIFILILITMYYHVIPFSNYALYIYPCVLIWAFDRLLRTLRILSFNPKFWDTKATVVYSPQTNILRLTVPYSKAWQAPRPGGFYYVYFSGAKRWWSLRGWESHPFTLAYSTPPAKEQGRKPAPHSPSMSLGTMSPPARAGTPTNTYFIDSATSQVDTFESESLLPSSSILADSSDESGAPPSTLTFLIRPYKGMTSRLRNAAMHAGVAGSRQSVLIEGPYGETQLLEKYRNVLFVVGGTGIAVAMSYLRDLVGGSRGEEGGSAEVRTRKIGIVWAVREAAFLDEVLESDMNAILGSREDVEKVLGGKLEMRAFITRRGVQEAKDREVELQQGFTHDADHDLGGQEEPSKSNTRANRGGVEVMTGRPDIFEEVERAVIDARDETLAVVACGPAMMADDARRAVVELLGRKGRRGRARIEYFEESFNW